MIYLGNAFSPMMVKTGAFHGHAISLDEAKALAPQATSIVSHPNTAQKLGALLGFPVSCDRQTVELIPGDQLVCIIPKFRDQQAREFTDQEINAAEFKTFLVEVES